MLRCESREVGHFGRAVRNTLDCRIDVGPCLLFFSRPNCLIKEVKNTFLCVQCVLIQGPMFICLAKFSRPYVYFLPYNYSGV